MSIAKTILRRAARLVDTKHWLAMAAYSQVGGSMPAATAVESLPDRETFHREIATRIGRDSRVLFLEFGVHKGDSLVRFANAFSNPASRFIGFDSFEGLPEPWAEYEAGHFSLGGEPPTIDDNRVSLVKGWFSETVPGMLAQLDVAPYEEVVLHMDADLFGSTLLPLTAALNRLPRFHCIFDEFVWEEMFALYCVLKSYGPVVSFDRCVGDEYPKQLYCRIEARRDASPAHAAEEAVIDLLRYPVNLNWDREPVGAGTKMKDTG